MQIDQAHRGYYSGTDSAYASVNPMYMRYTPDSDGNFSGQAGYGYKSLEEFVVASTKLRDKKVLNPRYASYPSTVVRLTPSQFDQSLATIWATLTSTAILEAGRMSLNEGKTIHIVSDDNGLPSGYSTA